MLYFTELPDHKGPGFNERLHFNRFTQQNVVFHALANKSHCDHHVGCLSIKTVLSGEEVYGFNGLEKSLRPGQFIILNDDQPYRFRTGSAGKVKNLSVFFKKEFAADVFRDAVQTEEMSLDSALETTNHTPEFFQTLCMLDDALLKTLKILIFEAEHTQGAMGDSAGDEHLIFLLHLLLRVHRSDISRLDKVDAIKSGTRKEIYKRLCIAKDFLHSTFMNNLDLRLVSHAACLSVPQLVRQFKAVFHTTPYQYLVSTRLSYSAGLLKNTNSPVNEIARASGFENTSAFCRAFKTTYGTTPLSFRNVN
jgi:AraC-like DNA-binding protein